MNTTANSKHLFFGSDVRQMLLLHFTVDAKIASYCWKSIYWYVHQKFSSSRFVQIRSCFEIVNTRFLEAQGKEDTFNFRFVDLSLSCLLMSDTRWYSVSWYRQWIVGRWLLKDSAKVSLLMQRPGIHLGHRVFWISSSNVLSCRLNIIFVDDPLF